MLTRSWIDPRWDTQWPTRKRRRTTSPQDISLHALRATVPTARKTTPTSLMEEARAGNASSRVQTPALTLTHVRTLGTERVFG